jgi:general secretion pathway protein F/type IV pilus assembly protein PilC
MATMLLGHRKLAAWYQQLAQHLDAGLPLADALRASQGTGASAGTLEAMALTIEAGGSAADALRRAGSWLPYADLMALTAAAETGRMPRTLVRLAARHEQLGAAKLRVVLACAYPLAILHFGLLLLPVVRMIDWEKGFQWSTGAYLRGAALGILPLWALGITIWILARRGSPWLARIAAMLPALRGYVRAQALSDFSFALGNFLEAGVPIAQAWATAGLITPSRKLKAAAQAMESTITRGEPPGKKLDRWPCFPADFIALYRTGEATGQLDVNLLRIAAQKQDAANRALGVATVMYPMFTFMLVAGAVAYFVISIYAGYLKMLGKLAE